MPDMTHTPAATPSLDPSQGIGIGHRGEVGGEPDAYEGSAGEALQAEREDALVPASPISEPVEVEGDPANPGGEASPPPAGLTGFTPGPWCVTRGGNAHPFSVEAESRTVAFVATAKGDAEANARLISAAPGMYEVLATIENDAGQVPSWLWDQIQAALAKATGNATERGVR
jgi:hypothetical protein